MTDAYAIPSCGRPDTIGPKTLTVLAEGGVPPELVHLFVPDLERQEYDEAVDPGLYGEIHPGGDTLGAQRRAIAGHFGDGARVVQVDDDMRALVRIDPDHPGKLFPVEDVAGEMALCWAEADLVGARLWGVYPTANGGWMKHRTRTGLSFVCGGWFGLVVDTSIDVVLDQKEDYERSLRYWSADGTVARHEWLSFKTTMYTRGGMQSEGLPDRRALNAQAVAYIRRTWPSVTAVAKRTGKAGAELRLKAAPDRRAQQRLT